MQSLLSPAESHAFQSFLSSIDYADPTAEGVTLSASEWALYNGSASAFSSSNDPLLEGERDPEHREALAKATKDLMSLDSSSGDPPTWDSGGGMPMSVDHRVTGQQGFTSDRHEQAVRQLDQHHEQRMLMHQQQVLQHQQQQGQRQRQPSFSTTRDHFPFLSTKPQRPLPELTYPAQPIPQHLPQHGQSGSHTHLSLSPMKANADHSHSPTTPASASLHSPFAFQQQQSHNGLTLHHPSSLPLPQQVHIPPQETSRDGRMSTSRSLTSIPTASRPVIKVSTSTPAGIASSSRSPSLTNGKATRSGTNGVNVNGVATSNSKRQRSSSSPSALTPPQPKQALLSPSQKKANHIQSEQKRRANIRRGYEALCETVPALREAIREEEEAERNGNLAGGRRKSRGKKGKEVDADGEKERTDGRAGPRSENVVLAKTIDHIQGLLSERSALLTRLHRARSALPPGHPALTPLMPDPPWEKEWKGGEGKLGGGVGEDDQEQEASDGEEGEEGD